MKKKEICTENLPFKKKNNFSYNLLIRNRWCIIQQACPTNIFYAIVSLVFM